MRTAPTSAVHTGSISYSNCSSFIYYTASANQDIHGTIAYVDPSDGSYYYFYPPSGTHYIQEFKAEL